MKEAEANKAKTQDNNTTHTKAQEDKTTQEKAHSNKATQEKAEDSKATPAKAQKSKAAPVTRSRAKKAAASVKSAVKKSSEKIKKSAKKSTKSVNFERKIAKIHRDEAKRKFTERQLPKRYYAYIALAAIFSVLKAFLFVPIKANELNAYVCDETRSYISVSSYLKNNRSNKCAIYEVKSGQYILENVIVFIASLAALALLDKLVSHHKESKKKAPKKNASKDHKTSRK